MKQPQPLHHLTATKSRILASGSIKKPRHLAESIDDGLSFIETHGSLLTMSMHLSHLGPRNARCELIRLNTSIASLATDGFAGHSGGHQSQQYNRRFELGNETRNFGGQRATNVPTVGSPNSLSRASLGSPPCRLRYAETEIDAGNWACILKMVTERMLPSNSPDLGSGIQS